MAKLKRNIPAPWSPYSLYGVGSKNNTHRSILWESLDTTPGEIALKKEDAAAMDLPPTPDFPWDLYRSNYLINGFHQIHCLVRILRLLCKITKFFS